ncbi:hypothetical protein N0V83_002245 [Neocucurbitaria cava]|uniref:Chitin synthase export chaperone n=1 Tax=Neocucurbitaria cava TaxID=798079 RepID=A0A9W8YEY8_9PLEO|nr:hypothetical protein N0V83_002245 [Neocucurbitaria cava]
MAPRRGGGSGGGGSISTCPGAFSETYSQVNLANIVLFFVITLGISIALCSIRKKSGAGKKILGIPYIIALFLFLISYALDLISLVLQECDATTNNDTYFSIYIATNVFWYLAFWLLLFIVVYVLNTMLRQHLGGATRVFNIVYLAIVGVMFALTAVQIGISSYNLWTQTDAGYDSNSEMIVRPAEELRIAYNVLYLLSVLASGALALMTVFALRSRRHAAGDLLGWIIALYVVMLVWCIIGVVFAASFLQDKELTYTTTQALSWIYNLFQALTFIFLLCIAKHVAWTKSAETTTAPNSVYAPVAVQQQPAYMPAAYPQQQQYAYNGNNINGQQQYHHYNQAPVYNGQGGAAPLR